MATKIVVDCSNNTSYEVELTAEEIAQREKDAVVFAEMKAKIEAEEQARVAAKQSAESKLSALGLTPEEIAAITK